MIHPVDPAATPLAGDQRRGLAGERLRQWPRTLGAALVLVPLPFVLFLIDSSWAYNELIRDPWIYHGYFENGTVYLALDQALYFVSRMSVHLPGFVVHHLLPPLAANLVLRLALHWTIVGSFYLVARAQAGRGAALPAAIGFGCYPWLLAQVGSDYVAAFGIAYLMLAMLALTRAQERPRLRRLLYATAGAAAAAMIAANLSYVLMLPPLALHHLLSGDRPQTLALRRGALWGGAGAAAMFAGLGATSWAFGGAFLFLRPSLGFVAGALPVANPFRDATYSWLPDGAWLILPAAAVAGAVVLLARALWPPRRVEARRLSAQIQLLVLAAPLVGGHIFFDRSHLQYPYYAILLAPFAFLALANQLATLLPLPQRASPGLAATALGAGLLPYLVPQLRDLLPGAPWRLAIPLAVALVPTALLASRVRGPRGGLTWVLALGIALGLASYPRPRFPPYGDDGAAVYRQVTSAIAAVEELDPSYRFRLWYDYSEAHGRLVDSVASAFQLCSRMVSGDFPKLHGGRLCDGVQLAPGMPVIVMSTRPDAIVLARDALRQVGMAADVQEARVVPGPAPGFTITLLAIRPLAAPAEPIQR